MKLRPKTGANEFCFIKAKENMPSSNTVIVRKPYWLHAVHSETLVPTFSEGAILLQKLAQSTFIADFGHT